MASSNRHWPSMFKSKPCNPTHLQWQPDNNLNSSLCHRTPYTPGPGSEERTPEPKPRWNPRPEQIRILESIFNSGMVNPPRDEIRKIRAQLQEYGQVGDANVFYWFQNRKSRSKHKQRQLQNAAAKSQPSPNHHITTAPPATAFSSSSSSEKSSPNSSGEKCFSVGPATVIDLLNSPTASVNQPFFQASSEFLTEPFFFPVQHNAVPGGSTSSAPSMTQGFCFGDAPGAVDPGVGNIPGFLLSELMLLNPLPAKKEEEEKMKLQQLFSYPSTTTTTTAPNPDQNSVIPPSFNVPSHNILQGVVESGPTRSMVFINDVCFEVGSGPFSVREAFGDDAVLIQSSGQPVMTNEWGVTVQPLQHGSFYYLLRAPSPDHDRTIDLI